MKDLNPSDIFKRLASFTFSLANSIAWIGIYIILMLGAMSSMLLLIKLYPELAISLFNPFRLFIPIIIKLVIILLSASIIFIIFYFLFKNLEPKIKEAREKRKLEFIDNLVDKIVVKLKRKI